MFREKQSIGAFEMMRNLFLLVDHTLNINV